MSLARTPRRCVVRIASTCCESFYRPRSSPQVLRTFKDSTLEAYPFSVKLRRVIENSYWLADRNLTPFEMEKIAKAGSLMPHTMCSPLISEEKHGCHQNRQCR